MKRLPSRRRPGGSGRLTLRTPSRPRTLRSAPSVPGSGQLLGQLRDAEHELTDGTIQRIITENTTLKQRVRQLTQDNRTLEERLQAARSNNRFADRRIAQLEAQLAEQALRR